MKAKCSTENRTRGGSHGALVWQIQTVLIRRVLARFQGMAEPRFDAGECPGFDQRRLLDIRDLQNASSLEFAMISRIGAKSLALLYELKGEQVPDVARLCGKAMRFRNMLNSGTDGSSGGRGVLKPPIAPLSQAPGAAPPTPTAAHSHTDGFGSVDARRRPA